MHLTEAIDVIPMPPPAVFPSCPTEVACAWTSGFARRRPAPGVRPPRAWQEDIAATLEPLQRDIVARCVFYLGKARGQATAGDFDQSCRLFGQARLLSQRPELGRKAKVLCAAELEPAEAYLDFVCDDLRGAESRLVRAMEADQVLEDEFGHASLHVHRVHLANNLVKVRAKAGMLEGALHLAAAILRYVGGCSDELPVPTAWTACRREAIPPEARDFLFRQTTFEIACAMAGEPAARWTNAWRAVFDVLPLDAMPAAGRQVRLWFACKKALLQAATRSDVSPFASAAEAILDHGPDASLGLWQLAALDCLLFWKDDQSPVYADLADRILSDLEQSPGLPRHVRAVANRHVSSQRSASANHGHLRSR